MELCDHQNTVHGILVVGDKIRIFRIHYPDAVDDVFVLIASWHQVADGGEGTVTVLISQLLGVFAPAIERAGEIDGRADGCLDSENDLSFDKLTKGLMPWQRFARFSNSFFHTE